MTNEDHWHAGRAPDVDGGREALDPAVDPVRWEGAVRAIMAVAEPELRRRRRPFNLLLDSWARPILSTAASLILLASASLYWTSVSSGVVASSAGEIASGIVEPGLEDALYPPVIAEWLEGRGQPTVEDLVFAQLTDG